MDKRIDDWFTDMERFLTDLNSAHDSAMVSSPNVSLLNEVMYSRLKADNYQYSYVNPGYSVFKLGEGIGRLFSFLSYEAYSLIGFKFDGESKLSSHYIKLFEDIKLLYEYGKLSYDAFYKRIRRYLFESCEDVLDKRARDMLKPRESTAYRIIMRENLADASYLYKFGEYITETELETARFLNTLRESEISDMASVFTGGYKRGFEITGRPFDKKRTVGIIYKLGFERLVKEEILQFKEMGLDTTIFRSPVTALLRRGTTKSGYSGADANEQAEYDHARDLQFFLDKELSELKLQSIDKVYSNYCKEADAYGGPAVMEVFGKLPFDFKEGNILFETTERQKKQDKELTAKSAAIINKYIKGEERSFTIIAYPTPDIGKRFREIFYDTAKLNTLDNETYCNVQQQLIDVLDRAEKVCITGENGNDTSLTVALMKLENPEKQDVFENCVADVNIPLGEVFTSPKLKGTEGVLFVKKVFLNGYEFRNLWIKFENGFVADYSCGNYSDPKKGKEYFRKNVLFNHETLPIGEFAIGTNTTAYAMAKKYNIENILPILIAEKCGPHFALGDTCYAHSEDVRVFNPNGKEIVAKDNEVSVKRKTDDISAYFNCHTDITIPYEEIGALTAVSSTGEETDIIKNGRFVLEGTDILNVPLIQIDKKA